MRNLIHPVFRRPDVLQVLSSATVGIAFGLSNGAWGQCDAHETTKLTASDAAALDFIGRSVAVSGDLALIGAIGDDDVKINAGAAYVFRYNGTGWIEQVKLAASDGARGDALGWSVAISGDVAVIIAFLGDAPGAIDSGSAYVFQFDGTEWTEEAKLTSSDAVEDQRFGSQVSISDHVVVIGAWNDNPVRPGNFNGSGSAYVFVEPPDGWVDMTETAKLNASDAAHGDHFGRSVSISGDVILIGSLNDDDAGMYAGSAYVFDKPKDGWDDMTETAKLIASDAAPFDFFGHFVSISGDVAVIGATGADGADFGTGAAYVFRFTGARWIEETKLTASDGEPGNAFGGCVSINSEGLAAIGAYFDNDAGTQSGSAYFFRFNGDNWIEEIKLTASDAAANDQFGFSVSVSADVAVIGAWRNDEMGTKSGSVYVFGGLGDCNENGEVDLCDVTDGTSQDTNGNGVPDECECPWDLDANGSVGASDLLSLLVSWGPCKGCPADFDNNGNVGASDLLALLANWGPCP